MDETQQPRKSYTLVQLEAYLQHESPYDFLALPHITSFTFRVASDELADGDATAATLNPICHVHLLLGQSTGEYTDRSPVYLRLRSEGNNAFGLNCSGRFYKFALDNLSYVDLEAPFLKLLKNEKEIIVLHDSEKRRLKAWACYLFLKSGCIKTVRDYPGFEDDLRYACARLAKGGGRPVKTARQKAAALRQKESTVKDKTDSLRGRIFDSGHSGQETHLNAEMDPAFAEFPLGTSRMSSHDSVIEGDGIGETPLHAPKKRKFCENMTELRRHYDEVGQHLVAFETKFASMKLDPQEMRELKKVNAKQTNEIGKLKAKVGKLEKDLLEAKMDASMSEQAARKENAAREEESQRKEEAEARLNKLLEAHKRMTTMFSGI